MTDIPILADEVATKVKKLCYRGYQCYDDGDFQKALRTFYQAWLLLPKPKARWREGGWALTAIGDTYFRTGQYRQAREALSSALRCPATDQSPFVHLRLGQVLYELNERAAARHELAEALRLGGAEVFAREEQKYRAEADAACETDAGNH